MTYTQRLGPFLRDMIQVDSMSIIEFFFYNEDGTASQPDVDRGYLRFLNRNLINVLTSRPDDVVVPVDYPIGLQTKNIDVATDYA